MYNQKNCINLIVDHPVDDWINKDTSNRAIKYYLFNTIPQLSYVRVNSTHYRWCGPLLSFAEQFTKITKTR